MKTTELIRVLSQDARFTGRYGRSLWTATLAGFALAALLFAAAIGMRADIEAAAGTTRFLAKILMVAALGITALNLAFRIGRPGAPTRLAAAALLLAPSLLAIGVVIELVSIPSREWATRLVGNNMVFCLTYIPMLALGPLALLLAALRGGAPESPALAGAVAGLAASSIGAILYATHCTDDSPLFVATWYTIAIGLVTGIGALAGSRLLRW